MNTTVLRDFIRYLQNKDPQLSQTEVGRRAGVSQSVVNKIMVNLSLKTPDPETFRRIAGAYPKEWNDFLRRSPTHVKALQQEFGWAVPGSVTPAATEHDPDMLEAVGYLRRIFSGPRRLRAAAVDHLRVTAGMVRALPVGQQQDRRRR